MGSSEGEELGLNDPLATLAMKSLTILGLLVLLALAGPARAATNLVVNGSFDDRESRLKGWKYRYDPNEDKNAGWYVNNHDHVAVVESDGAQRNVLTLWGDYAILQVPGQGTKVDSDPIPFDPKAKYRFSCRARTSGPNCRILLEGYKWRPGVKPHPGPGPSELRKCYKFSQLYFGGEKSGSRGGVSAAWTTDSSTFPEHTGRPLQEDMLKEVDFVIVHIVAIDGSEGYLYVDDVKLEKTN
jgi:hypothetical protein